MTVPSRVALAPVPGKLRPEYEHLSGIQTTANGPRIALTAILAEPLAAAGKDSFMSAENRQTPARAVMFRRAP
jgi:hypothetical protein